MNDYNTLSSQLDQLSVDINTQNLRSKLEKTKRQRLNSMIKNIECEIALLSKTVTQTQANITDSKTTGRKPDTNAKWKSSPANNYYL